jgi:predicted nucleotidyltransferase
MMASIIARHRAALRAETIEALRAHLSRHPPLDADRVILFGSLARGDFDGASDADVMVIGRALPDDGLHATTERGLDILMWTPEQWSKALADGNPFALEIERDGIDLWRAPEVAR